VFALRNLPEVVKGALFSRYSRTEKSLRRVLLDEFINEPDSGFEALATSSGGVDDMVAVRRAEEFYERVLVDTGTIPWPSSRARTSQSSAPPRWPRKPWRTAGSGSLRSRSPRGMSGSTAPAVTDDFSTTVALSWAIRL